MHPIEAEITRGRIESLRVCHPTKEEHPLFAVNPVLPWGSAPRLAFRLGHREVDGVSFPWPLSPPPGRPDDGTYFTTIAIRPGEASRRLDALEKELKCLLGELAPGWWNPPKEIHHKYLLRLTVDRDTTFETRAFLGGAITGEDASVVTKGCYARVDVELVGVRRSDDDGGAHRWRPQLRALHIRVLEGVGVYARAGIPLHNSQICEPPNTSALDYRGRGACE